MRRLPARLFAFWWGQGIADDVPALTYYLLLSVAPTALGIAALEALLLGDVLDALEVVETLNRYLPEAVHPDVRDLVLGAQDNSPWLLGLAIGTMLWTTSGAIGVIERVESRLLGARRHSVVVGRLRNMALGVAVATALVASAAGAPVIGDAAAALRVQEAVPGALRVVLLTLVSVALFAIVLRMAPRTPLHWRSAVVGAVPAGMAVQVLPTVLGLWFGAVAGVAVVRVFLLLAALLVALYLMAAIVLAGAGLAVRSERRQAARAAQRAGATDDRSEAGGRTTRCRRSEASSRAALPG